MSVAVVTNDGGRISSNASALRSSASWHSALPSVAPGAAQHREHRAGDLRGALVVEDAESGGGLPVRHPLVLGERLGEERPFDDGVVVAASTVGRLGVRQVGDHEQVVAQGGAHRVVLGGEDPFLIAERPALGLERLGSRDVARRDATGRPPSTAR